MGEMENILPSIVIGLVPAGISLYYRGQQLKQKINQGVLAFEKRILEVGKIHAENTISDNDNLLKLEDSVHNAKTLHEMGTNDIRLERHMVQRGVSNQINEAHIRYLEMFVNNHNREIRRLSIHIPLIITIGSFGLAALEGILGNSKASIALFAFSIPHLIEYSSNKN